MKKVNGKQKGNGFERLIANLLSDRFKEYLNIDKGFIRNASSGAYFGGKNQKRVDTHLKEFQDFGDIITPSNFKYVIECKSYKSPPSLNGILKQEIKQWDTWIDQVEQDSLNANKKEMLIIKYNNTEYMCFLKEDKGSILKYKNYFIHKLDTIINIEDNNIFFEVV